MGETESDSPRHVGWFERTRRTLSGISCAGVPLKLRPGRWNQPQSAQRSQREFPDLILRFRKVHQTLGQGMTCTRAISSLCDLCDPWGRLLSSLVVAKLEKLG